MDDFYESLDDFDNGTYYDILLINGGKKYGKGINV